MSKVPLKGIVYCKDDEDDTVAFAYIRIHQDQLIDSKRPHSTRRIFFLNEEKSRCLLQILSSRQLPGPSRIWRSANCTYNPHRTTRQNIGGTSARVMRGHVPRRTLHLQRRTIPSTVRRNPHDCQKVPRQEVCQFYTCRFALYGDRATFRTGSINPIYPRTECHGFCHCSVGIDRVS